MKPPRTIAILFCQLLIGIVAISAACTRVVSRPEAPAPNYSWRRVIEPGKGCFQESGCAPGQWAMAIVPIAGFENKLFTVGWKQIWSSADGLNWSSSAKTDWGSRYGMTHIFFDKKIWMLGGMKSWDRFENDVWYSTDGKEWKLATAHAAWTPRRNHQVVVFNNRMWLLGGAESSGRADQTPTRFFNDVWTSTDGVNWTQTTAGAEWPARDGFNALVFDNRIWVIGGEGRRDVWSSKDGKTWVQATGAAEWSDRRGAGAAAFDGKIWVFGGIERNDVWFSRDGKRWEMAFAHAPWSTRTAEHTVVFDNRIWIFGGKTGRPDSWVESGDVWIMQAGR